MKSRSKSRPPDHRPHRLGFAKPQLELLEDRLQPSIVFGGQEWAFLAADSLEADPSLAAKHAGDVQHLPLVSGQEQHKPLPTPAAAPVSGGDQHSAYGAVAQPAMPIQSAQQSSQNAAPPVANASAALAASGKDHAPSAVSGMPTTVSRSLGAVPLTQLQVGINISIQQSLLTPAATHAVPQQIHPDSSQNWATYITGTNYTATGQAVTVDVNGNAYVTGAVNEGTGKQAFVAVYDSNGDTPPIFFATFQAVDVGLNGDPVVHFNNSEGTGIALDGSGNIYIVGTATNPQTRGQEAFVMRFDSTGNVNQPYALDPNYGIGFNSEGINLNTGQLEYLNVNGNGIVVGPDGTATIVGTGNFQDALTGQIRQDIFLAQINPDGTIPLLGDGQTPYAFGFAPGSFGNDSQGNALFTSSLGNGIALSPDGSTGYISGTGNTPGGSSDGFVLSFTLANPVSGNQLTGFTLNGAAQVLASNDGPVTGNGIAVGADGTVYQGGTYTYQENGQTSPYPYAVSWMNDLSTYVNQGLDDSLPGGTGTGISVDPAGNVYLTGSGFDSAGSQRAFVDFLQAGGGQQFSVNDTYLTGQSPTGSGTEAGWGVAYSAANNSVFLVGDTNSSNLSTDSTTLNGSQDAFLASVGNFGT
jgi:hypothetical protein